MAESEAVAGYEPRKHFLTDYLALCKEAGVQPARVRQLPPHYGQPDFVGNEIEGLLCNEPTVWVDTAPDGTPAHVLVRAWSITAADVYPLFRALEAGGSLSSLRFWNVAFDSEVLALICNLVLDTPLQALAIDGARFDDDGSVSWASLITVEPMDLAESMTDVRTNNLISLSLRMVRLNDEAGLALGRALSSNTTLKSLSLWGNDLTDKGAMGVISGLRINRTLRNLDLGKNAIGDACLAYLQEVLTEFKLTQEEVVVRRKAVLGLNNDENSSRPTSRMPPTTTPKTTNTVQTKKRAGASTTPAGGAGSSNSGNAAANASGSSNSGNSASNTGAAGGGGSLSRSNTSMANTMKKDRTATTLKRPGKNTARAKVQVDEPTREHAFLDHARKDENHNWYVRGNHAISRIGLDYTLVSPQGLLSHLAPVMEARRTPETPIPALQFTLSGSPAAEDETAVAQLSRSSKSPTTADAAGNNGAELPTQTPAVAVA